MATDGAGAAAAGVSTGVVKGLVAQGALDEVEAPRDLPYPALDPDRPGKALSPDQAAAAERLSEGVRSGSYGTTLLKGVTGSGKTEVYFRAAEHALAGGCETPWEKADAVAKVAPLLAVLDHPNIARVPQMLFQIADEVFGRAFSEEAIVVWTDVTVHYPTGPLAEQAARRIAQVYESQLDQPLRAAEIYQELNFVLGGGNLFRGAGMQLGWSG